MRYESRAQDYRKQPRASRPVGPWTSRSLSFLTCSSGRSLLPVASAGSSRDNVQGSLRPPCLQNYPLHSRRAADRRTRPSAASTSSPQPMLATSRLQQPRRRSARCLPEHQHRDQQPGTDGLRKREAASGVPAVSVTHCSHSTGVRSKALPNRVRFRTSRLRNCRASKTSTQTGGTQQVSEEAAAGRHSATRSVPRGSHQP